MTLHRATRVAVSIVASVALVAGCSSSDDPEELSLDPSTGATGPAETEAPDDPNEDDPDDGQLFPPLPDLEPDPDSDIPVDAQELGFELHERLYEVTQAALTTNAYDEDELAGILGGALLDDFIASIEEQRARGVVSRQPDTTVEWVEVVSASGGPIIVQDCRLVGPETGDYGTDGVRADDAELGDVTPIIVETEFALIDVGDGTGEDLRIDYRAVESTFGQDLELCDA